MQAQVMTHTPSREHALGLIGMSAITSIMMTTPVISLYLNARGLPAAHIGAVIGIMSLALVLSEVALAVTVASRIGRRSAIALALTGSAATLGGFPLIGSVAGFYLNRITFGAIRGLLWPVLFAEVTDAAHPERRGRAFAVFWLYFGVGNLIGPAVGGWLGEWLSLPSAFYAAAAMSVLALPLVLTVGTTRDPAPRNPLAIYPTLFRARGVSRTWALTACNVVMFSVYSTFLPLHAAGRGLSPAQIGVIFTGGAIAFIIGQDVLRRVSDRWSPERLLPASFIARGAGVAMVPLLTSFGGLFLANFAAGVLTAVIPLALTTRIAARAPRDQLVAAMAGFNASADLGFFVGPLAGGLLAVLGLRWAFWLAVPVTAAALLLLRGSRPLGPGPDAQQSIQHHRSEEQAQIEDRIPKQPYR
ncbi:MAG TPA: MFS transporter [bacterium]